MTRSELSAELAELETRLTRTGIAIAGSAVAVVGLMLAGTVALVRFPP